MNKRIAKKILRRWGFQSYAGFRTFKRHQRYRAFLVAVNPFSTWIQRANASASLLTAEIGRCALAAEKMAIAMGDADWSLPEPPRYAQVHRDGGGEYGSHRGYEVFKQYFPSAWSVDDD